jgi:hypothetical protein
MPRVGGTRHAHGGVLPALEAPVRAVLFRDPQEDYACVAGRKGLSRLRAPLPHPTLHMTACPPLLLSGTILLVIAPSALQERGSRGRARR